MEFRDLKLHGAIFGSHVADTFDAAQRRNIERIRIGARGEGDEMLRADGGNQFAGRAESDLFAVIHDSDAFAEALRFVHVVRGEKDGAAGGFELLDQIPELAAGLRVQAGGGLIEKKKIGIADEGAGQRKTLFLAARKIADAGILFFLELHERNGFVGARALLKKAAEETECFEYCEFFGELRILQLNAESLAKFFSMGTPVHSEQFHFARIGSGEAFADFDGSGFAGPVGPEKAEALARVHLEVEAIDGDDVLIGFAEAADAKGRSGGRVEHETSIASRANTFKPSLQEAGGPR